MFTVFCPGHDARVLLGPRSVVGLANTSEGVVLHWWCRCGTTGVLVDGRPARHEQHDHTHPHAAATAA